MREYTIDHGYYPDVLGGVNVVEIEGGAVI